MTMPDPVPFADPYTMDALLCNEFGYVCGGPMHHGTDYLCTGSAHFGGHHIRCTNIKHVPYEFDHPLVPNPNIVEYVKAASIERGDQLLVVATIVTVTAVTPYVLAYDGNGEAVRTASGHWSVLHILTEYGGLVRFPHEDVARLAHIENECEFSVETCPVEGCGDERPHHHREDADWGDYKVYVDA